MHGNVYEWCEDWKGSYSGSTQVDPMGPSTGSARVFQGGRFGDSARGVRSADRNGDAPSDRGHGVGFRLVRRAD